MICVAWSLWSGTPGRFGFPGWAEVGLEGRRPCWAGSFWACSSCIPKAGRRWCGARVEKPRFLAGIPVGRLFTILGCVLSMPYPDERGSGAQSSSVRRPPGDACTLLLILQSAFLEPYRGPGQEGDRSPPAGMCQGASPSRPLLPEGGRGPWPRSTLLFSNSSAASGSQTSVSGTGVPLSAVGNHGLASWEGGKGAEALPRERSCPLQMEPGPETLLLLPSQAPLSACHQNSIPSASPAVFGHSSLPPVKEQLVVAAYVSVCRVREGGGEKGPSQQFLFLNVFFLFCFVFLK